MFPEVCGDPKPDVSQSYHIQTTCSRHVLSISRGKSICCNFFPPPLPWHLFFMDKGYASGVQEFHHRCPCNNKKP
uniref:TGF_BETA_2 domain-containing protein n=1 Tax=Panagrellus redivivus TaxID=6233 RepID=A0A7E4W686_PANRE